MSRGPAMACYIAAVASIVLFAGPLVVLAIAWLRRDDPFVQFHARQVGDLMLTAALVVGGLYAAGLGSAMLAERGYALAQWGAYLLPLLSFVAIIPFVVLAIWGLIEANRERALWIPGLVRVFRARVSSDEPVSEEA